MATHTVENNSNTVDGEPNHKLTEEEASRYDRQMRLWGLEAQQRCITLESTSFRFENKY
jgi:ubiquitin-like 1-activating enzyme E1 A